MPCKVQLPTFFFMPRSPLAPSCRWNSSCTSSVGVDHFVICCAFIVKKSAALSLSGSVKSGAFVGQFEDKIQPDYFRNAAKQWCVRNQDLATVRFDPLLLGILTGMHPRLHREQFNQSLALATRLVSRPWIIFSASPTMRSTSTLHVGTSSIWPTTWPAVLIMTR